MSITPEYPATKMTSSNSVSSSTGRDEIGHHAADGDDAGKAPWAKVLNYSTLGIEMGISPIVGYFIGRWLDGKLGSTPVLSIIMLLAGIASGFFALFRTLKRMEND